MSNLSKRLEVGGIIDRSTNFKFSFNGRRLEGYRKDTVASALMANGVDVLSRSFKYHRPRGVQNTGFADVSSMVEIEGDASAPNLLASTLPLEDGLKIKSANCWPSVEFDLGAALRMLSPLIPAGFYYKTFIWPHWHFYEPPIRKLAGFGKAPQNVPAQHYSDRYDHVDILVVGAGLTGLLATIVAAKSGARVLLVDENQYPGGRLIQSPLELSGQCSSKFIEKLTDEIDSLPNATRLQQATAWGYYEGNMVTVVERKPAFTELSAQYRRIWAKQVIITTGAIERSIVFENNDRPGILLTSAASTYINTYAIQPGNSAVLLTNNNFGYKCLHDLVKAGVSIEAVVDTRRKVPKEILNGIQDLAIEIRTNSIVQRVAGRKRVSGAVIRSRDSFTPSIEIECDLVCVSGGWNPTVHLYSQAGGSLKYCQDIASFIPNHPQQNTWIAGSANGTFDINMRMQEGIDVGAKAVSSVGFPVNKINAPEVSSKQTFSYEIEPFWNVPLDHSSDKAFVDFAGDVTVSDLKLAIREGYDGIEHLKRYTTTGMGLDQGKSANVVAIGIAADLTGQSISDLGFTTFRPPYSPVEFGSIAGSRIKEVILPYRHTPMTGWHQAADAVMYEAGAQWTRPGYYPKRNESMEEAINRECIHVRHGVGIYDGSPLAKFELKGKDTEKFLNLIYTNEFGNLNLKQGRYGFMLTEDGRIFDDGVSFRIGEDRYLLSGSTGNGNELELKLERLLNLERPDLQVLMTPVTSQWANATVCGPVARLMLQKSDCDIDLSAEKFPFMHLRTGTMFGLPVRIFRVSFTGELSFEINTPARYGLELWNYLMELGRDFDICPIGSEANHVLRVEKGFISLAHEVDETVDPIDLGLGWIVSKNKSDFIGKRALEIRRSANPLRKELVGLLPCDEQEGLPEGAPIVARRNETHSEGFVSAGVWSPTLEKAIALGILENGRSRHGETIFVKTSDQCIAAVVTKPVFYDSKGVRLRS